MSQEPFNISLPTAAKTLFRTTNSQELRVMATRLETIVNKFNDVVRNISAEELPLFDKTIAKINEVYVLCKIFYLF